MNDLALVPAPQPTLLDLARSINHEHEQCLLAAVSSLQHAIRAGEALLAAKEQVPRGGWEKWLDANCPSVARMSRPYMRIATYREMLPADASTAIEAHRALRGLPAFDGTGPHRHPPEVRDEAVRLVGEGLSRRMVASMLGIGKNSVDRWMKPTAEDRETRNGSYRVGRPTRAVQKEREKIAARERQQAIGPAALAASFRGVVEAHRRGEKRELAGLLRDLAKSAAAWADQIDRGLRS